VARPAAAGVPVLTLRGSGHRQLTGASALPRFARVVLDLSGLNRMRQLEGPAWDRHGEAGCLALADLDRQLSFLRPLTRGLAPSTCAAPPWLGSSLALRRHRLPALGIPAPIQAI